MAIGAWLLLHGNTRLEADATAFDRAGAGTDSCDVGGVLGMEHCIVRLRHIFAHDALGNLRQQSQRVRSKGSRLGTVRICKAPVGRSTRQHECVGAVPALSPPGTPLHPPPPTTNQHQPQHCP